MAIFWDSCFSMRTGAVCKEKEDEDLLGRESKKERRPRSTTTYHVDLLIPRPNPLLVRPKDVPRNRHKPSIITTSGPALPTGHHIRGLRSNLSVVPPDFKVTWIRRSQARRRVDQGKFGLLDSFCAEYFHSAAVQNEVECEAAEGKREKRVGSEKGCSVGEDNGHRPIYESRADICSGEGEVKLD